MNSPEDALRAVEALAELMEAWIADSGPDSGHNLRRGLERLRAGCLALRKDKRGDADARAILDRDESPL